ncbi:hypothetical protein HUG10_21510 (plasmid) [Halorarum halophilum]|uniref:Uncharacterized protein n=1 Tax=Halorarum halophilum TaxID=2743090 RepID=A0A7D5GI02_9EURY|nr:hypothetical protein [Halobaculum halophilum]QLG30168.1 hypothetical protein HUG10_21510 [Halobaculum halophilum]
MSDDNPSQHTVALADLSVQKIRSENEQVAEELARLEGRVETLESEKAEAEATVTQLEETVDSFDDEKQAALDDQAAEYSEEIDELNEELEAKTEIINEIREAERAEALGRLREAYAAATGAEDEEVDEKLAEFEEAPKATVEAATEGYEVAAERSAQAAEQASGVESEEEDLGGTAENASADTTEDRKAEIAREMGVLDQLEAAENLKPQGFEVNPEGVQQ